MVKGISRQVIVVHPPEPKLFEQAIFILREDAVGEGVTDDALLKEAQEVIRTTDPRQRKHRRGLYGAIWALGGAGATAIAWYLSTLF